MFGKRIHLFTLFGFPVRIDLTWFILLFLITWSLALGYFPMLNPGLNTGTYWILGLIGALGLFLSVVLHEFSHSLVARHYGLPMRGITLFIFGGVAEMGEEPERPKTEFLMAIAGPIASFVIAGVCFLIGYTGSRIGWPSVANNVWGYLALINVILGGFNLLPAFPLDGGRVLRAILWNWKQDLIWATKITSHLGGWFGTALVILGLISLFSGVIIGGIWWILIGIFLRGAAHSAYKQLELRHNLEGETVRRFMKPDPVSVPSHLTLQTLVNDYFYRYYHKMFPVVDDTGHLQGCVNLEQVKTISPTEWDQHFVSELTQSCTAQSVIPPDTEALQALTIMSETGTSKLLVAEEDHLVGILSLKDLMDFLAFKMELGSTPRMAASH